MRLRQGNRLATVALLGTLLAAALDSRAQPPAPLQGVTQPGEVGPPVKVVAFSPDGKFLAAGSGGSREAGWVGVWEVEPRKPRFVQRTQTGVPSLAFSPDGATLAVVVFDQPVQLLNAQTGAVRSRLKAHAQTPRSVAFSPDGKTLATGSYDQTIKLWDLDTLQVTKTLTGHTDWVYTVAFAPDGKTLASASRDQSTRLWDLTTGQGRSVGSGAGITGVVLFSPDGRWLLEGVAAVYEVQTGRQRIRLNPAGSHESLAYSASLRLLAMGPVFGGNISLFDLNLEGLTMKDQERIRGLLAKWDDDSYEVREAASKDLKEIGLMAEPELERAMKETQSAEVRIRARRLLEEVRSQPRAILVGHSDRVSSLATSPDGKLLASASWDGTIRLWDLASRKELAVLAPAPTTPP